MLRRADGGMQGTEKTGTIGKEHNLVVPVGDRHACRANPSEKAHDTRKSFFLPEMFVLGHCSPHLRADNVPKETVAVIQFNNSYKKRGRLPLPRRYCLRTAATVTTLIAVRKPCSALLAPPEETASARHQNHQPLTLRALFFCFHDGNLQKYLC